MIAFTVDGAPVTQAGMRAVPIKGKDGAPGGVRQISSGGKGLMFWRTLISKEASTAMNGAPLLSGPVGIYARFTLERPKSRAKREHFPDGRPDVSKLARALEDALSKVVYEDDARIVDEHVTKRYVGDIGGALKPGVDVVVWRFVEDPDADQVRALLDTFENPAP